MLRKRRLTVLIILMTAVGAILASRTAWPADAKEAGVLRVASPYTLGTLNPLRFMADYDFQVISQIYEPLITFDGQGRAVPALASSWRAVSDRVWEFRLRKDARWQTGNELFPSTEPVTPQDVVKTFDLVRDPRSKATFQSYVSSLIEDVKVSGSDSVQVITRKPYAFILDLIGHIPIVSQKAAALWGVDGLGGHPIGSGPFKWESTSPDGTIILKANPDYRPRARLGSVEFRTIADKTVAAVALENGDIDIVLQLPPQEVPRLSRLKSVQVIPSPYGSYRYAALNERKAPWNDLRMREAVSEAINLDAAVRAVFVLPQLGRPAWGPVPPGITGNDPGLKKAWAYSPASARHRFEQLGWTDADGDGLLEKNGQKLGMTIFAPNEPNRSKFAVILASQLRTAGIDARTRIQEFGVHVQDVKAGRADMAVMGGGGTPDGLLYMFHSRYVTPDHDSGYRNARLDDLLDQAVATMDAKRRTDLWRAAQQLAVQDRVHVAGYYEFINCGVRVGVAGFVPPSYTLHLADGGVNVSVGGVH